MLCLFATARTIACPRAISADSKKPTTATLIIIGLKTLSIIGKNNGQLYRLGVEGPLKDPSHKQMIKWNVVDQGGLVVGEGQQLVDHFGHHFTDFRLFLSDSSIHNQGIALEILRTIWHHAKPQATFSFLSVNRPTNRPLRRMRNRLARQGTVLTIDARLTVAVNQLIQKYPIEHLPLWIRVFVREGWTFSKIEPVNHFDHDGNLLSGKENFKLLFEGPN